MEKTINNIIRNNIFKRFGSQMATGMPLDLCNILLVNQLFDMKNSNDAYQKGMYEVIVSLAYIDSYKLLNYRMLNNDFNLGQDLETMTCMDKIDDLDDLLQKVSVDFNFLESLIHYFYEFNNIPMTARTLMEKSLNHYDNKHLLKITPLHQNDLDMYNRKIDASFLTIYYNTLLKLVTEVDQYAGFDLNHALDNIVGFLQKLSIIDKENTSSILKEMITMDYKYSKYLITNRKFKNNIKLYEAMSRIEFVEDKELTLQEVIDLYLEDSNFLNQLVESYIDITTDDIRSIYGKETTPLLVEIYAQAKMPEMVKEKLIQK